MAEVVAAASTLFTNFFGATGWVASVVSLITSNSFLLVGIALTLTGAAVGYLGRIIHS